MNELRFLVATEVTYTLTSKKGVTRHYNDLEVVTGWGPREAVEKYLEQYDKLPSNCRAVCLGYALPPHRYEHDSPTGKVEKINN